MMPWVLRTLANRDTVTAMRVAPLVGVVVGGCAVQSSTPPPQQADCIQHVSLDAVGSPTSIGPLTIDSGGVTVCIHLVAPSNMVSHFTGQTQPVAGSASPFDAVLVGLDGATLTSGWDVMISNTNPTVFTNLEWDPTPGTSVDAIFHVNAKSAAATTMLSLSLILPID